MITKIIWIVVLLGFSAYFSATETAFTSVNRIRIKNLANDGNRRARDVFELCRIQGFAMEQKPFSVGVRIEHSQQAINQAQWGKASKHPA